MNDRMCAINRNSRMGNIYFCFLAHYSLQHSSHLFHLQRPRISSSGYLTLFAGHSSSWPPNSGHVNSGKRQRGGIQWTQLALQLFIPDNNNITRKQHETKEELFITSSVKDLRLCKQPNHLYIYFKPPSYRMWNYIFPYSANLIANYFIRIYINPRILKLVPFIRFDGSSFLICVQRQRLKKVLMNSNEILFAIAI